MLRTYKNEGNCRVFCPETPPTAPKTPLFFLPPAEITVELRKEKSVKRNDLIRKALEIRKYGLSEPLQLRAEMEDPLKIRYILAENSLRWQAACLAELERVPCVLQENTPKNREVEAIFAQIKAKSLGCFELAAVFQLLIRQHGLTQAEVAQECGISQSSVANKLRLLQLSNGEKQRILEENLTERHARALLRLKDPTLRQQTLAKIVAERLTVADSEALVAALASPELPETPQKAQKTPQKAPFEANFAAFSPICKGVGACDAPPNPDAHSAPKTAAVASQTRPVPTGRVAIHTFEPLYTSLDRPLAILRRAGCETEMRHEEHDGEVYITIRISQAPQKGR